MRGVMMAAVMAIGVMVGAVAAQDAADIRHPPARRALARAEQETRKAEQAYRQALLAIQRDLVRELEQAKSDAMQRQLLDQANAIQAAIDAARGELDRLEGKPVTESFEVSAGVGWVETVTVSAGQQVRLSARGQWCANTTNRAKWTFGPEGGTIDGIRYGLVGKIGDQEFFVGRGVSFAAPASGVLQLRLEGGSTHNDDGGIKVDVQR